MLQVLSCVVLSFLVSDWIYSEVVLTFPQVGETIETVYREVKIPTHDEWPEGLRAQTADILKNALNTSVPLANENLGSRLEHVMFESSVALNTLYEIQQRRKSFGSFRESMPSKEFLRQSSAAFLKF